MLSVNLIERLFRGRRFEQLLDSLAANGLSLPLPLRVRLAQTPAAAVALGLRRLVELTYGPTTLSREMAGFLVVLQGEDGSFGGDLMGRLANNGNNTITRAGGGGGGASGGSGAGVSGGNSGGGGSGGDPLATAAAAAAMGKVLDDRNHRAAASTLEGPRERALAALSAMQAADGLFNASADRTDDDRALTAAFILLLLGRDDDFRLAVRSADLFDWFEQHQDHLDPQAAGVWTLARMGVPAPAPLSPAVAAIAA
ncbi:MAG: hypothetical protein NTW19_00620 [Planctomycetota bacterium]|nr:hypothetical protein [Planctomycetota bacterium]